MKTKLSVVALLCCAQLWMGCAAKNPEESDIRGSSNVAVAASPVCDVAAAVDEPRAYRIQPGDQLDVSFYLSPELHQVLTVRPDGDVSMPVAGNVHAQGLTPAQLEESLDRLYALELRDPKSTVRIDKSPWQVVYVEGQVAKPGAVPLQPGMTALQAIAASGGLTDAAGASRVVLIRRDACGNPHGEQLKLDQVLNQKDNEEDVGLLPADIVVVPRSGIAQFDLNIKQYVRDAMPLETIIAPGFL
jgi:protein involved in polysaccharide export with SLBB domain